MTSLVRSRTTVVAVLLAVFALASALEESHSHKPLSVATHHLDLPTFTADHEHLDRTVHIEAATPFESSQCIGCLLRQRQRTLGSLETELGEAIPGFYSGHAEARRTTVSGAYRLPTSRAPPQA